MEEARRYVAEVFYAASSPLICSEELVNNEGAEVCSPAHASESASDHRNAARLPTPPMPLDLPPSEGMKKTVKNTRHFAFLARLRCPKRGSRHAARVCMVGGGLQGLDDDAGGCGQGHVEVSG